MKHAVRHAAAAAVVALALGGVAACGTSAAKDAAPATAPASSSMPSMTSPTGDAPPATPGATSPGAASTSPAAITITGFVFAVPAAVRPGAKVTVSNEDRENHSVTADADGGFDVPVMHGTPVTFTAPTAPGRYPFHCSFHGTMKGVLVVR
jgi:plastocyanin